jgi:tetratricopeptide (TPR) repeat protein
MKGSRAFIGLLARLGYAYQELANYPKAIETFEQARTLAPGDGLPDLYLAQALIAAGNYDRAIEIARAGRPSRPDDQRFVRLEAQALREAGRYDEAISLLAAEWPKHKEDSSLALSLATVYGDAKRWNEGHKVLDEAAAAFPDDLDIAFQKGALFEQEKRFADAERVFRALLARDPQHAQALNYLGYMLADRGERLDEAVQLITRALDADPYNGSYLDSLGWAWFRKGDPAKARGYLEKAASQLPRNSVVQDHLGDVLRAAGDVAGAVAAWKRALDGDMEQVDVAGIRRKIDHAAGAR